MSMIYVDITGDETLHPLGGDAPEQVGFPESDRLDDPEQTRL